MAGDEELKATISLDSEKFSISVNKVIEQLQTLEGTVQTLGGKLENALDKSLGKAGRSLEGLSLDSVAGKLSAASDKMQGALKSIVDPAVDFQRAMREVNTVAGLSDAQLAKLSEQTRTLGKELGIGIAPTEAAAAQYDILSAGFSNAADAQEILKNSIIAAKGGMTSTAEVADLLTSTLNAYGKSASESKRVTDILAESVKLGKVRYSDFVAGLGSVAPAAASNGVSLEELAATMAALTAAGQQPARAFTALNAAIVQLSAPTKEARAAAASLGVDLDSAGFKALPLAEKLQLLARRAGDNKSALRQVLGDVNALGVAFSLAGKAAPIYADAIAKINGPLDTAREALAQTSQGVAGAQERFTAAAEAFKIGAAESLLPALTGLANAGTKALETLDALPKPLKDALVQVGGLTAVLVIGGNAFGGFLLNLRSVGLALGIIGPAATAAAGGLTAEGTAATAAATATSRFGLAAAGMAGPLAALGIVLVGLATRYVEVSEAARKAADDAVNAAGKMTGAGSKLSTGAIIGSTVPQLQQAGVGAEDIRDRIRPLRDQARQEGQQIRALDEQIASEKTSRNPIVPRIEELQKSRDALVESSKKLEDRIAKLVELEGKVGERAAKAPAATPQPGGAAPPPVDPKVVEDRRKQALFEIEQAKVSGQERIKLLEAYIQREGLAGDEKRKILRDIAQIQEGLDRDAAQRAKQLADDQRQGALQDIELSKASHEQKIAQLAALAQKYKQNADFQRTVQRQIAQEEEQAARERQERAEKRKRDAEEQARKTAEGAGEVRGAQQEAVGLRQSALGSDIQKATEKGDLKQVQRLLGERQRLAEESIRLQLAEQLAATQSAEARVQLERNAEERIRQEKQKTADEFKTLQDEQLKKAQSVAEALKPKGASTEFTGGVLTVEQLAQQMSARFSEDSFGQRQAATAGARAAALQSNLASLGSFGGVDMKRLAENVSRAGQGSQGLAVTVRHEPLTIFINHPDGRVEQRTVLSGVGPPGSGPSSVSTAPRGRA